MTTAIAIRKDNAPAVRTVVDSSDAVDFPSLVEMGNQLVKTGFLPDHIRTGAQFAAIVMTGKELGMTTMRATRSLAIVKGKVVEDAASQLARFKAAGGRATFPVLDDTKAVLWLQHPNGDEHTETWTTEDSRRAGLVGGNHDKYRKAMLRSRVITAGLKSVGWDGAVGVYGVGELDSDAPPQVRTVAAVATVVEDDEPPAPKVDEKIELVAAITAEYDRLGVATKDRKAETAKILGGHGPTSTADLADLLSVLADLSPPTTTEPKQAALIPDDTDKRGGNL